MIFRCLPRLKKLPALGSWLSLLLLLAGCGSPPDDKLVVYTSLDPAHSEPVLRQFTEETGIEVRVVQDETSANRAGIALRLRLEKDDPICDLYWSDEEMQTRLLAEEGIFREDNGWRPLGYRTRRLVINTNLVPIEKAPRTLLELTNQTWNGQVALPTPLSGAARTHFLALKQLWGEDLWKAWCYGLVRNGAKVVNTGSEVVKLVGSGAAAAGLADLTEIELGKRQNLPLLELPFSGEFVAVPLTVGLPRNSSRPDDARLLADYLARDKTLALLKELGALEGTNWDEAPDLLKVDWSASRGSLEQTLYYLKLIFGR